MIAMRQYFQKYCVHDQAKNKMEMAALFAG